MMLACSTFHRNDSTNGVDEHLGTSCLWSIWRESTGDVYTVPDLSIDVVWFEGELPVVARRTIEPMSTCLEANSKVVGLRLSPAVNRVEIDLTWPGWRVDTDQERRLAMRRAAREGAIGIESNPRLKLILHHLNSCDERIPDVARRLGASERQLQRWTAKEIGLRPKQLSRLLRVRRFQETEPSLSLGAKSVLCGFYDQAHACNEVKVLTGLTALELAQSGMSASSKT